MRPLTLTMIANLGCTAGLDMGRWNSCDAWSFFDLEANKERLFVRLHDRKNSPPLLGCSRAYDIDSPADGTEKIIELPEDVMQFSADAVRGFLIEQLLELVPDDAVC